MQAPFTFLRRRGGEGKNGPKNIIWGSGITIECPVLEKNHSSLACHAENHPTSRHSFEAWHCRGAWEYRPSPSFNAVPRAPRRRCRPSSLHSPFLKLMGGDWKRDRRLGLEMEQNGLAGKKNGDGGLYRELRIDLYNMQQSILRRTCMHVVLEMMSKNDS